MCVISRNCLLWMMILFSPVLENIDDIVIAKGSPNYCSRCWKKKRERKWNKNESGKKKCDGGITSYYSPLRAGNLWHDLKPAQYS